MVLPRPSLVVAIWFAQFSKTAAVYRQTDWKQVIRVQKLVPPTLKITWVSFVGSEEPSLKFLHSAELQSTNSSPISHCRCSTLNRPSFLGHILLKDYNQLPSSHHRYSKAN